MRRALRDWPIVLNAAPSTEASEQVQVSFIIGHRGRSRVPHLLATLRSIAAQRNVSFECIVVEQANEPEVETLLPGWVRHVHTPLPQADMPYSRSWAFNVGADLARGHLLILNDNDMLVPQDYAAQLVTRFQEGYEVINLKRFVFYVAKEHSERIMASGTILLDTAPESVVQNLEAGGSFAIARDAYHAIGGFDESFVGWGGEDNEFWERGQTRNVWPYGYMPLVHLWHEAQSDKVLGENAPSKRKYWQLSNIPPDERIRNLVQRQTA
ncbi:MAG TPA: galactosyltransferase-related protein [Pyrinomonadaceae bacterium]|nr:galactosyltransferase-related protein [Pyrinomonadaceae bacterium]